ncbi:hypothetical protein E4U35_004405 [Claviceps purpurea]|nr:hypothetical protein E4U38_008295 [Claviceps purpurea]KAG6156038.1 hypothetical protein E4U37_000689 [Claviceps purpurea]KAG6177993.1 hypothetical protein E4U27_004026 [Claviceps purpurea]KAG6178687.1 hypothetical protein E4U10_008107 [Claviceps purpurea]KAG6210766.1 hypothetical protein E4U35_004405 [Claviceps purpurea]
MRLLTLLPFACGALALATGPVRLPADQRAVDGGATVNLEDAVLADHESTRQDEEASQSLEKRMNGITMPGIVLPKTSAPAALLFNGLKITFSMGIHWVKSQAGEWVYEHYVQSMHLLNELNRRISVQIIAAGQTLLAKHMNQLGEGDATLPEGTQTFDLYINELHDGEL